MAINPAFERLPHVKHPRAARNCNKNVGWSAASLTITKTRQKCAIYKLEGGPLKFFACHRASITTISSPFKVCYCCTATRVTEPAQDTHIAPATAPPRPRHGPATRGRKVAEYVLQARFPALRMCYTLHSTDCYTWADSTALHVRSKFAFEPCDRPECARKCREVVWLRQLRRYCTRKVINNKVLVRLRVVIHNVPYVLVRISVEHFPGTFLQRFPVTSGNCCTSIKAASARVWNRCGVVRASEFRGRKWLDKSPEPVGLCV